MHFCVFVYLYRVQMQKTLQRSGLHCTHLLCKNNDEEPSIGSPFSVYQVLRFLRVEFPWLDQFVRSAHKEPSQTLEFYLYSR